jgi:hypothetical protein
MGMVMETARFDRERAAEAAEVVLVGRGRGSDRDHRRGR